jgi:uncharacterized RDD family membrane protein YckC
MMSGMTQPPPYPGQDPRPGYGSPQPGYPGYPGYAAPPGYGTPGGMPGYPPGGQPYGPPGPYGSPYQPHPAGWNQYGKDPRLAEWWQRLVARILDGLVLGVLTSWIWIWAFVSIFHQFSTVLNQNAGDPAAQQAALLSYESHLIGRLLLVEVAYAAVAFLYDWLQHGWWGQTLGKRAMGIVVVSAADWSRIGLKASAARAAVYTLPGVVPYAGGPFELINMLWLLWDQRRQCLHDKAARTVVAKKSLLAARGPAQGGYPGGGAPYPGYWMPR